MGASDNFINHLRPCRFNQLDMQVSAFCRSTAISLFRRHSATAQWPKRHDAYYNPNKYMMDPDNTCCNALLPGAMVCIGLNIENHKGLVQRPTATQLSIVIPLPIVNNPKNTYSQFSHHSTILTRGQCL